MVSEVIYTVTAYRWGDREMHSYMVGVYFDEKKARRDTEIEEERRSGKYICEIIKWFPTDSRAMPETIKELPKYPLDGITKRSRRVMMSEVKYIPTTWDDLATALLDKIGVKYSNDHEHRPIVLRDQFERLTIRYREVEEDD